jgi:hypothetical protein
MATFEPAMLYTVNEWQGTWFNQEPQTQNIPQACVEDGNTNWIVQLQICISIAVYYLVPSSAYKGLL